VALVQLLGLHDETKSKNMSTLNATDKKMLQEALLQAKASFDAGGIPIGAVLARRGEIIGRGHNQRVQEGDPIAHGEMDCLRKAGRQGTYKDTTLYTTLSPCKMCSGTIVQFGISKVVIGENRSFGGNEEFLRQHGVEIIVADDKDCRALMERFKAEQPTLWREDIGQD
jgi:cytosine/creatinine deaminase